MLLARMDADEAARALTGNQHDHVTALELDVPHFPAIFQIPILRDLVSREAVRRNKYDFMGAGAVRLAA